MTRPGYFIKPLVGSNLNYPARRCWLRIRGGNVTCTSNKNTFTFINGFGWLPSVVEWDCERDKGEADGLNQMWTLSPPIDESR